MLDLKPSITEIKEKLESIDKKVVIPIWHEIIADLETPVSAYFKVCNDRKFSFLLESVDVGENFGRFSYIGADPLYIMKTEKNFTEITNPLTNDIIATGKNPYDLLENFLNEYTPLDFNEPFSQGATGYFGFESIKYIEPKLKSIIENIEECQSFPEAYFMIAGTTMVFDHVKHKIYIINSVLADKKSNIEAIYKETEEKINDILVLLENSHGLKPVALKKEYEHSEVQSNISKEEWINSINKAKEYIKSGDIFQIVLSQRFCINRKGKNTFDIYRALRSVNPSPFLYYLNFNDFQIVGSSPEIMVKCTRDKEAYIRPIAGTRPRGNTHQQDLEMENELLSDPKEIAEHVMLVDLGRNDLGRVCKYGSVKVDDFMKIERYSHVMHIVSDVIGQLEDKYNSIELLKACFPAGTVSGAPKIRAMEIIAELEKSARGPYAGSIGRFNFNNEINTAITIRTMLVRGDNIFIQAGAGIVADSDPEMEYIETQNKAAALIQTIERLQ